MSVLVTCGVNGPAELEQYVVHIDPITQEEVPKDLEVQVGRNVFNAHTIFGLAGNKKYPTCNKLNEHTEVRVPKGDIHFLDGAAVKNPLNPSETIPDAAIQRALSILFATMFKDVNGESLDVGYTVAVTQSLNYPLPIGELKGVSGIIQSLYLSPGRYSQTVLPQGRSLDDFYASEKRKWEESHSRGYDAIEREFEGFPDIDMFYGNCDWGVIQDAARIVPNASPRIAQREFGVNTLNKILKRMPANGPSYYPGFV
jgi:hypothetical protein